MSRSTLPSVVMTLASVLISLPSAQGAPLSKDDRDAGGTSKGHPGSGSETRTIVVVVCLCYILLLAAVQGYRYGKLAKNKFRIKPVDILVFSQSFVCTGFVISIAVLSSGLGLGTDFQCHSAIQICIAFYGVGKILTYIFLLERAHIVRAPFIDRFRDRIWIVGIIFIVCGFAGVTIFESISPHSKLSHEDGICRIGISEDARIAVIVFDSTINVALTGLFIWLLRPILKSRLMPEQSNIDGNSSSGTMAVRRKLSKTGSLILRARDAQREENRTFREDVKTMAWRNVIGSALILLNTVVNNTLFLTLPAAGLSHICFLTCLTDLTWSVLIINWLTIRSDEEEQSSKARHDISTTEQRRRTHDRN